jgi:NAD(P)-dependent dehydrogenase (short-subunit alcohol dehydrogenase family)
MPGALTGKVALVTGGTRGIGYAIARALACEGARVIITGRDNAALITATESLGEGAQGIACDVRDEVSVSEAFAHVQSAYGKLDILVNNAGIAGPSGKIEKLSYATWREIIDTNLTGVFLVTRAALPLLTDGATVVNNTSIAAKTVFPSMAGYNASKYGALGFTESLREEVRPRGIRVINLMPGAVDTDIWQQFWPQAPRKNMMSPESIAQAVLTAVLMPEGTAMQEIAIVPTAGKL